MVVTIGEYPLMYSFLYVMVAFEHIATIGCSFLEFCFAFELYPIIVRFFVFLYKWSLDDSYNNDGQSS
jgi:hypothetical protein